MARRPTTQTATRGALVTLVLVLHGMTALAEPGPGGLLQAESAARAAPSSTQAQIAYGRALIRAGKLGRAATQMQRAVKVSKRSPEALFEVARVKFAMDDYKHSRAACRTLQRAHRGHILSEICLARAFLVWRRASRAEGHIRAALTSDPNHVEALFALAEATRYRGEHDKSASTYRRVLQLDPAYVEAHVGLARLQLLMGDRAAAEKALRAGITGHPEHPEILYLLGSVAPPAEGVGLLERALSARPKWNEAEQALGAARLALGQHGQAEQHLRAVLKRDPKSGLALGKLGEVLAIQGHAPQAEATLLKALEVQPMHADAALALARLYGRTGRHEDAFEYFRKAAGMRATDSHPLVEAAELARSAGRTVLAAAFLERALERHPNQPHALAMRGDLLAARGDKHAAVASYKQALTTRGGGEAKAFDRGAVEKKLRALE